MAEGYENVYGEISSIRDQIKKIQAFTVPPNSYMDVNVSNPCFVFCTETDTNYGFFYCGGTNVTSISSNLDYNSISKQSAYVLRLTNNMGWIMRVWLLSM